MSSSAPRSTDSLYVRAATLDDVPAITAVLDAATRTWVRRPTSPDQVTERLGTPHTDISRDTAVAVDRDNRIVGFGHVWPAPAGEGRCFARTHPDRCGRGVGAALQRHLIDRAAGMDAATHLTTTTLPGDVAAEELLARCGYTPARYFLRMEIERAPGRSAPVPEPPGVTVREFTPSDGDALFSAYTESFAAHWGGADPDPETWWRERRDDTSAGYDPTLWLVALDGGEIAGFAIAKVQLDAENTTGAVRLYTKLGMRQRQNFTIWSRPLPAGPYGEAGRS